MNRRYFFGLSSKILGALSVGIFGKEAWGNYGQGQTRGDSKSFQSYGVFSRYRSYGFYGAYGSYGPYGSYGTYGVHASYGAYGVFGVYGTYGMYGVFGYDPFYGEPLSAELRSPSSIKPKKKSTPPQGLNIDFESLTNKKS